MHKQECTKLSTTEHENTQHWHALYQNAKRHRTDTVRFSRYPMCRSEKASATEVGQETHPWAVRTHPDAPREREHALSQQSSPRQEPRLLKGRNNSRPQAGDRRAQPHLERPRAGWGDKGAAQLAPPRPPPGTRRRGWPRSPASRAGGADRARPGARPGGDSGAGGDGAAPLARPRGDRAPHPGASGSRDRPQWRGGSGGGRTELRSAPLPRRPRLHLARPPPPTARSRGRGPRARPAPTWEARGGGGGGGRSGRLPTPRRAAAGRGRAQGREGGSGAAAGAGGGAGGARSRAGPRRGGARGEEPAKPLPPPRVGAARPPPFCGAGGQRWGRWARSGIRNAWETVRGTAHPGSGCFIAAVWIEECGIFCITSTHTQAHLGWNALWGHRAQPMTNTTVTQTMAPSATSSLYSNTSRGGDSITSPPPNAAVHYRIVQC